jgi:methyl-accepting chemotaxis protein
VQLKQKLIGLVATAVVVPVAVVLCLTFFFSGHTREMATEQVEKLADADLDHLVVAAVDLAEASQTALALERETAVKNYLRALAESLLQRTERLFGQYPRRPAWPKIRDMLLAEKIGQTGYAFGMDSSGVLTMHPSSEGTSLAGSEHIDRMRQQKSGYITYHSVTAARDKAVYYVYFEPLDLIIAPGVFVDEMASLFDAEAEAKIQQAFHDRLRSIRIGESGGVWALRAGGAQAGEYLVPPRRQQQGGGSDIETTDADGRPYVRQMIEAALAAGAGQTRELRYRLAETPDKAARRVMTRFIYYPPLDLVIGADAYEDEFLTAGEKIARAFRQMNLSVIAASAVVALVSLLLAGLLSQRTARSLRQGVSFAQSVARGDLSTILEVTSSDEIGELTGALNGMVDGLTTMATRVRVTTGELAGISERLAGAARSMVRTARDQAGGVEETSSAITEINASVRQVAEGVNELSAAAEENNSSILEMTASIEEVAVNAEALAQSVQEVGSAIGEMVAAVVQIADNVGNLKQASETTVSAMTQMDAAIHQVGENARGAAGISESVRSDAGSGQEAVGATIAGVGQIREAMQATVDAVSSLSGKADNIGKIVSMIDDVAAQTSLLALNAAIIAAQAGESGRSFAVVADEIKELAGRTAVSTREIAEVVYGVQQDIQEAVANLGKVDRSVADGEQLSLRSGEALGKIVAGIQQVNRQVQSIARATEEQAGGSRMAKSGMEQVSALVSQIATATREQEKGARLIMGAAERMKGMTEQVHATTREQSRTSRLLAGNTERTTAMVRQISRACDEQSLSSEQIVKAMAAIQASTQVNLEAARIMEEGVAGLSAQVDSLQAETSAFRLRELPDPGRS